MFVFFLDPSELQKLVGQKLKDKVTIRSVSLAPLELKTQTPEDASINFSSSTPLEPQNVCTV